MLCAITLARFIDEGGRDPHRHLHPVPAFRAVARQYDARVLSGRPIQGGIGRSSATRSRIDFPFGPPVKSSLPFGSSTSIFLIALQVNAVSTLIASPRFPVRKYSVSFRPIRPASASIAARLAAPPSFAPGREEAGAYAIRFDGAQPADGMEVYRLEAGDSALSCTMAFAN